MIEYCIVEKGVSVGRNCLLSNVHLPVSSFCGLDGCGIKNIHKNEMFCVLL